jgi:hypothetical protein
MTGFAVRSCGELPPFTNRGDRPRVWQHRYPSLDQDCRKMAGGQEDTITGIALESIAQRDGQTA